MDVLEPLILFEMSGFLIFNLQDLEYNIKPKVMFLQIKKRSARIALRRNGSMLLEATRRRRRILQARFYFKKGEENEYLRNQRKS